MKQWLQSPWTALTLAIAVISIAYTVYVQRSGIAAASMFCPVQQACTGSDCMDKKS